MDVWQSTREYLGWKTLFNLLYANWIWSSTFTFGSLSISDIYGRSSNVSSEQVNMVLADGYNALNNGQNFVNPLMGKLNVLYHTPTVGASGAVFGLFLAFGMFSQTPLSTFTLQSLSKLSTLLPLTELLELWLGLQNNASDNVAHFAHLGGMLFGYLLIKYWRKNSQHFY